VVPSLRSCIDASVVAKKIGLLFYSSTELRDQDGMPRNDDAVHWSEDRESNSPTYELVLDFSIILDHYNNNSITSRLWSALFPLSSSMSPFLTWNITADMINDISTQAYPDTLLHPLRHICRLSFDSYFSYESIKRYVEYVEGDHTSSLWYHHYLIQSESEQIIQSCLKFSSNRIKFMSTIIADQGHIDDFIRPHGDDQSFSSIVTPFRFNYDADACLEPLWCDHTIELQKRIEMWQFPNRYKDQNLGNRIVSCVSL
jgi:hypothetical protein